MEVQPGEEYRRPKDAPASWPTEELGEVRRIGVGELPIAIETIGGEAVFGYLDQVRGDVIDVAPTPDGDRFVRLSSKDVAAFTILPGPEIDTSDELRS
jgi:hypothetical protein